MPVDSGFLSTVIVPSITVLGSVGAASLSYYLSRKKQIEEEHRKTKVAVYEGFYLALIEMARDNSQQNRKSFADFYNRLLFTGSDGVIRSAVTWKTLVDQVKGPSPIDTPELKTLLDEMRRDLGISKSTVILHTKFAPMRAN